MAPQTGVIEIESHEISETSYKLVDWYGPGDGTRPLNWPLWRKVSLTTATCILAFIASLGSSIFSACLQQVQESFKVSYYIASMGVSLYVLGFSFGKHPFMIMYNHERARNVVDTYRSKAHYSGVHSRVDTDDQGRLRSLVSELHCPIFQSYSSRIYAYCWSFASSLDFALQRLLP